VLRGPDSLELEGDLAKVERCLRNLSTNDTLSPQESTLRTLYYTHLRDKLRLFLARSKAAGKESGERLDTTSAGSERLRDDNNLRNKSALNQVDPSDESWKAITPPGLIRAVTHIRKDFGGQSFWKHYYSQKQCFNDLHPLVSSLTEPAIFRKYFYACVGELRKLVSHAFERLLAISLAQKGIIGAAAIEWAALQVTDLIELEDRFVDHWIKSACDGKNDAPRGATLEDRERHTFWTDWRAPEFLLMKPNGNSPYNASTAWERMDEGETKSVLKAFREDRWILLLKATLEEQVGTAHEVLARQASAGENRQELHEPASGPSTRKPGRPPRLDRSFVECAGALWQKVISEGHGGVPIDKLRRIATVLDSSNYLPPSAYLERKFEKELKAFNSRNSNSKIGPIKTWSELVSRGDKDLLRGMRRLLSRCAEKLDDGHPLSGN
jgi:hypothetical protein